MAYHSSLVCRARRSKFMESKEIVVSGDWHGRQLIIKTGRLAHQADAAVTVQYGDTVVLATVVEAQEAREDSDFFPLMVDFEERLYAAGIIKGSRWVKREGRPTDEAILNGRMIDRSIRPLFDESSRRDVQVILTVLSVDQTNDYDIVALIAASAALRISGVNWRGPIGGVRVGRINGEFIYNPTYKEREQSDLDLIVAGTKERVIMIEAGAQDCLLYTSDAADDLLCVDLGGRSIIKQKKKKNKSKHSTGNSRYQNKVCKVHTVDRYTRYTEHENPNCDTDR